MSSNQSEADDVQPLQKKGCTAAEFVEIIEEFYEDARAKRMSRLDVRWGTWSVIMNKEINDRIKSGEDPEELRLRYVFVFWVVKSQLLELFRLSPLGRKIKILESEAATIKEIILGQEEPGMAPNQTNIVERILSTLGVNLQ